MDSNFHTPKQETADVSVREEPAAMETGDVMSTSAQADNFDELDTARLLEEAPPGGDFEQDPDSMEAQIKRLEIEKANAERSYENIAAELNELKARNIKIIEKNKWLEESLSIQSKECLDRQSMYQKLEDNRNEIAERILLLETELNKTKTERDERDSKISTMTREKQILMTENGSLKDELSQLSKEKTKVTQKLDELEQSTGNITMEREWRKMDSQMYEESKKWFMKEITERDAKVSQLYIDIRAKEMKWKNDELQIMQQLKKAEAERIALEEKLELKEEALARVTANIENQLEKSRLELKNLETDLKVKEELAQHYKEQFEKADGLVEQLGEEINLLKDLNRQAKELLEEVRLEREDERAELQRQIDSKESQVLDLKDEISRLNEALSSKHSISLNEEELTRLFPSAADSSRFLKSDSSLTSLFREQARLTGELESERERSKQLEMALKSIVEEIETSVPDFNIQREKLNEVYDENARLKEQLQEAEDSRIQVESNRDQALRELAFNKAELEKYQRDCIQSHKRIQRLLFVIEKESRTNAGQVVSQAEEKHLFDSISQLLRINSQLEQELAAEKSTIGSRTLAAQSNELLILRQELDAAKANEQQLHEQLDQINGAFDAMREQNQKLLEWTREDTTSDQLREVRMKLLSTTGELEAARMAINRLEATVSTLQEEKKSISEISETRLSNAQNVVHELKALNAKLEAKFEFQNQIAETNAKEMDLIQKEIERVNKENQELMRSDADNAKKINELHMEIMRINDEYGQCKVNLNVQAGELSQMKSSNARLEAELKVFQGRYQTDQHVYNSILDINERLRRVQTEKESRVETQMEVLQIERDNLKRDTLKLNEQLMHSREETKNLSTHLAGQISNLNQKIMEKDEQIRIAESALHELKLKLEKLQSSTANSSTDDMSPERLRKEVQHLTNRLRFMESQLEEAKGQLESAKAEAERKQSEAQRMELRSNRMEGGLKDVTDMLTLEKQRLQVRAEAAEGRVTELAEEMVKLQNIISDKATEYEQLILNSTRTEGELKIKIEVQQQQIMDANNRVAQLTEQINNMNREQETNRVLLESVKSQMAEAESKMEEATSSAEGFKARILKLQTDLQLAEDNAKLAEEAKLIAQNTLEARLKQAEADQTKWQTSITEQDAKLKDLILNYDRLVEQFGNANDAALMEIGGEGVINPDLPQAALDAQKTLIEHLRSEKEKAFMRSMAAEVESKRLRSELDELLNARTELVQKIRKLEVEAAEVGPLTIAKADLQKRIQELGVTQKQFQQATLDKEALEKKNLDLLSKFKQAQEIANNYKASSEEANLKNSALTMEIENKNREIEQFRMRLQQQAQRVQQQGKFQELQKVKTELKQKEAECERISAELNNSKQQMDAKYKDLNTKFEQTRIVARKYRDEVIKLQKENVAKGEGQSTSSSATDVDNSELEKLRKQIEDKDRDHTEAIFRINLLTAKITSLKDKVDQNEVVLKNKDDKITELERLLQLRPGPSTLTAPVTSSVQPTFTRRVEPPVAQLPSADDVGLAETVSPPDAGLHLDVESQETTPMRSAVPTSSKISPGIQLFGRTGPVYPPFTDQSAAGLVPEPRAEQMVSGSSVAEGLEDVQNDSESRDSAVNMPVSSTGGPRKRAAGQSTSQMDPKRARETSNEAVSSSEERMGDLSGPNREDDAGFIPDPIHANQQQDEDDDDVIPVDPPNHGHQGFEYIDMDDDDVEDIQEIDDNDEEDAGMDNDEDDEDNTFEVPDSDEGASEMDNADDSEDSGDEEGDDLHPPHVLIGSEDDEDGVHGEIRIRNDVDQDVEVIGADDNSRSQPIFDDQDREAASAVEEADDEGRVSADGGIPNERIQAPPTSSRALRVPITFDRDDQCSSSNETGTSSQPPPRGGQGRRARPTMQPYQPKRGAGFPPSRGRRGGK